MKRRPIDSGSFDSEVTERKGILVATTLIAVLAAGVLLIVKGLS